MYWIYICQLITTESTLSSAFSSINLSGINKFSSLSISSDSLANDYYAYLYNLTNLIKRIILTILPALVPTLEALPALANWAADDAPAALELLNKDYVTHPISNNKDNVEIISSQKKNPLK